eukprot:Skav227450  [mRNA]  locus=scaffold2491:114911:120840:+ [translate_table: standard]
MRREKEKPKKRQHEERQAQEARSSDEMGVRVAAHVTPTDVEELINEAAEEAFGLRKGVKKDSHEKFHRTVSTILDEALGKHHESCTLGGLGDAIHDILMTYETSPACRSQTTTVQKDLFPLAVPECVDEASPKSRFLRALVSSLNSLSGQGMHGSGSEASRRVQKRLEGLVTASEVLDMEIPRLNFTEFFQTRGVDYAGEEIKLARQISWDEIAPSLPEQVGMLDIRQFCEGGIRHYIDNFTDFLVPPDEMSIGKTPKVMVKDGDWYRVAKGLLDKGVCAVLPRSKLFHIDGKPLLSGLFSVSKQEFVGDIEVCRLIMNLKPLNGVCRGLTGDTSTLPSVHTMGAFYLEQDELLCVSSEDIRCFFYLCKVPCDWLSFMGFGKQLPPSLLPPDFPDEPGYLCSQVLPMGFVNSVAIAQHIHRCVVRHCMGSFPEGLGGESELRRDRFFPQGSDLFRVYLDNFDQLQKCDRSLAELVTGTPSQVVDQLRSAYDHSGLPRHPKKAVAREFRAEVQGAWIDGLRGTCGAKPSKILKYVALALQVVSRGTTSQRELQVVTGGLVYISMFRRPLLSGLNSVWRAIVEREGKGCNTRFKLPASVARELIRFVGLIPLAEMDFRCPFDSLVTASDASTTGGGLCVSRGLSPYGQAASLSNVRGDIPEEHDFNQILSIGLFDGIAALRIALDALGLPIAGHISVEQNEHATRVVQSFFPDVITVSDVRDITREVVLQWATKFCNVGLIILGAGPPCQGVSNLNFDKKGALKDARSVLFKEVPRVAQLLRELFPWAQVHELIENVASMSYEDCDHMCSAFGHQPWYTDSSGVSLCRRPRVYWVTWELLENEGVNIVLGSDGRLPLSGEVTLTADVAAKAYLEAGWDLPEGRRLPTFTTSRPSPVPLRRPAGLKSVPARTKEERKEVRKTLGSLKSLTVQPVTKERYAKSLQMFYGFLHKEGLSVPRKRDHMDRLVSDYLEHLWSEGEGRAAASTFLASLQDFDPKLRGCLPNAWRLMKTWTTHEVPHRAPPLTESVLRAMVGWAKKKKEKDATKEKEKAVAKKAEEVSEELEMGQAKLSAIFGGSGLDPNPKVRQSLIKRARKNSKKKKKKKKKDSSDHSSNSSSSSSSSTLGIEGSAALHDNERRLKMIHRKFPGVLSCTTLSELRNSLMTQAGTLWDVDKGSLPPIYTQYVRQNLAHCMMPAMLQEATTLGQAIDGLLQGRVAGTVDILSQRLKSLESTAKGAHWTVGRQLELIRSEISTMTDEAETMEALRRAREEEKMRSLTGKGSSAKGGESHAAGKGRKGKDSKGNQKGKADERSKGKAQESQKDDGGGWNRQKK